MNLTIIHSFSVLVLMISKLHAQSLFTYATMAVDGFTCSQCALSVENSLRTLPFVSSVSMDINETEMKIFFVNGIEIDFFKLAKKVYESGFSVRHIRAVLAPEYIIAENQNLLLNNNAKYVILSHTPDKDTLNQTLLFVNHKMINKYEYEKYRKLYSDKFSMYKKRNPIYFVIVE